MPMAADRDKARVAWYVARAQERIYGAHGVVDSHQRSNARTQTLGLASRHGIRSIDDGDGGRVPSLSRSG
ncbi:hypothetical protein E2562_024152 [Oryza meyeriana var. granulata]|uniref:Uncharacterized protein n=1 Tax=Oryza meyeriana var. granulata TaxID=110450 RepID=A0A6G1EP67_9ORYZ|nr:hypothetical protein E2562_024152 [Oryza meyeriana var. granulata]